MSVSNGAFKRMLSGDPWSALLHVLLHDGDFSHRGMEQGCPGDVLREVLSALQVRPSVCIPLVCLCGGEGLSDSRVCVTWALHLYLIILCLMVVFYLTLTHSHSHSHTRVAGALARSGDVLQALSQEQSSSQRRQAAQQGCQGASSGIQFGVRLGRAASTRPLRYVYVCVCVYVDVCGCTMH
jgi:hypothetical protein